jgi:hypothetical protein
MTNLRTSRIRFPLGVSLMEVLISVALGVLIITLTAFTGFDYLKSGEYVKENETLVALLQKARSRSINNINGIEHGLHIDTAAYKFTIFEGPTYSSGTTTNEVYDYNKNINFFSDSGCLTSASPADIHFAQLTGKTADANIYIGDGKRCGLISLNNEGRIDW